MALKAVSREVPFGLKPNWERELFEVFTIGLLHSRWATFEDALSTGTQLSTRYAHVEVTRTTEYGSSEYGFPQVRHRHTEATWGSL